MQDRGDTKILVVEDDPSHAELILTTLKDAHITDKAYVGQERQDDVFVDFLREIDNDPSLSRQKIKSAFSIVDNRVLPLNLCKASRYSKSGAQIVLQKLNTDLTPEDMGKSYRHPGY